MIRFRALILRSLPRAAAAGVSKDEGGHSSVRPSFETPLAASRRRAPQDEAGVLASAGLMRVRAP
jgi:hypothetical protein